MNYISIILLFDDPNVMCRLRMKTIVPLSFLVFVLWKGPNFFMIIFKNPDTLGRGQFENNIVVSHKNDYIVEYSISIFMAKNL